MGLTAKEIENAKPSSKPYKLADGGGLCLLISPTGAKLWRWRYRFDGTEKMMALGEYMLVTLREARERHAAARKVLAAGVDPMAERKAEAEIRRRETEARPESRPRFARRIRGCRALTPASQPRLIIQLFRECHVEGEERPIREHSEPLWAVSK
jgi:hypothetical protein